MRMIRTVGELRELIEQLPDDMILVRQLDAHISNIHTVDGKFYGFCYSKDNIDYNCCKVKGIKQEKTKGLSLT